MFVHRDLLLFHPVPLRTTHSHTHSGAHTLAAESWNSNGRAINDETVYHETELNGLRLDRRLVRERAGDGRGAVSVQRIFLPCRLLSTGSREMPRGPRPPLSLSFVKSRFHSQVCVCIRLYKASCVYRRDCRYSEPCVCLSRDVFFGLRPSDSPVTV